MLYRRSPASSLLLLCCVVAAAKDKERIVLPNYDKHSSRLKRDPEAGVAP